MENVWRISSNSEFEDILNREDIVQFIKEQRLRQMDMSKKMVNGSIPKELSGSE